MDPLPDVLETYAMICEEDIRLKTMRNEEKTSGNATASRKGFQGQQKPKSSSQPCDSFPTKGERKCTHCGKIHNVEKCWRLHG